MASKNDLKDWVLEALDALGGSGSVVEVSRWIHDNKMSELQLSGDLLYRWQYDMRWAAQELRDDGRLRDVKGRKGLPWTLV